MNPWLFVVLFSVFNSAFASLPDLKSFIANKQYSKAIQLGEQLIPQNPNSPSALFYTALAYQHNQQNELAKKYYQQAIETNPLLPEIYNNLATIYIAEKDYTKAADTLTLAIKSQQSIATAYDNLSKIYRHLASQAYQKVLDEESRKKHKTPSLNTQLIASLNINETLIPVKTIVTKKPKPIIKAKTPSTVVKEDNSLKIQNSAKQTIIDWANAWKSKDYKSYINSYSKTYAPKNLTHEQWLAQREKRIKRPGNINVIVGNFDIKLNAKKAYINFDQTYRSNTYQDKVRKRMHLTLINNQWLITSEVTLSVL